MVLDSLISLRGIFIFLRYDLMVTFPILSFWAASGAFRDFSGWFLQFLLIYSAVSAPICLYSPHSFLADFRCALPVWQRPVFGLNRLI